MKDISINSTFVSFFILFCVIELAAQTDTLTAYHVNGNIESIVILNNGTREGASLSFYENGNPKSEIIYEAGIVNGSLKKYDSSGTLIELITVVNGRRDGPTSLFDSEGIFLRDVFYTEGKIVLEEESKTDSAEVINENILATKYIPEPVKQPEKTPAKRNQEKIPHTEKKIDELDDPAYYITTDILPEPVIGWTAFNEKIIYPEAAREKEISGVVKVRAFIDRDGNVERTEIVEGIGWGCDDALEIATLYSKFKPGVLKDKPVKVQMIIEHEFKLSSN